MISWKTSGASVSDDGANGSLNDDEENFEIVSGFYIFAFSTKIVRFYFSHNFFLLLFFTLYILVLYNRTNAAISTIGLFILFHFSTATSVALTEYYAIYLSIFNHLRYKRAKRKMRTLQMPERQTTTKAYWAPSHSSSHTPGHPHHPSQYSLFVSIFGAFFSFILYSVYVCSENNNKETKNVKTNGRKRKS